jgi:16S rRNA (uracil1498-N3)-methyltransferase
MSGPPRRFVVRPEAIEAGRVRFDRDETRHLARVLRLRAGDLVEALDGRGGRWLVRLSALGPGGARGEVLGPAGGERESPLRLVLAQGLPRADKMDGIVRMATELGVARIQPLLTARSAARAEAVGGGARRERWQRLAREATKQCGRSLVPEIAAPEPLAGWLAAGPGPGLLVCLWEGEASRLADRLPPPPVSGATLLVGPEGGFASEEVEAARRAGAVVAGLGPRILRVETAGPIGLALLQARYGDVG